MTTALSAERLGRLHDALAQHVERGAVPGLVAAVSKRGHLHLEVLGTTSVGGAPVRADSIFRISSMTKPVTAVATLLLAEEGTVALDGGVERFLPELADRRVLLRIDGPLNETAPASRSITVRDLLTFTIGFGAHFGPAPINDAAARLQLSTGPPQPALPPEPDEWLRRFSTLPLMCQPGERWLYNTGAELLGVLVARASGQSFAAFIKERICEPLGMNDTGFFVPPAGIDRLVTSYSTDPESGALDVYDEPDGQWSRPPAFPSGGAGLVSTASDFLAFSEMLLHGGAPLLSQHSVDAMTRDHLTPQQKAISGFFPDDFAARGFGFCVGVVTRQEEQRAPVGQYGWDGGLGSIWRNDPGTETSMILLTNAAWASPKPPAVAVDFLAAAHAAASS